MKKMCFLCLAVLLLTIADGNTALHGQTTPATAEEFFNRGKTYYDEDDYDKAIADYTQAIRLDPDYSRPYANRGNAYACKKDYDRAIADYNKAIDILPTYIYAYNNLGLAYASKGSYDNAISAYTMAIDIGCQEYPEASYNRGNAYAAKKDYDKAIADFSDAVRLQPNYTAAKNALENAKKQPPSTAEGFYNRGFMYAINGDFDKAIADLTQAIKLNANYADAYYNRGNIYLDKKDYDKAIADYEAALRIKPNNADTKKNLEVARAEKNRRNTPPASAPNWSPPVPVTPVMPITPSSPGVGTVGNRVQCNSCRGTGRCSACNGNYMSTCTYCNGTGKKVYGFGTNATYETCVSCKGSGKSYCAVCYNPGGLNHNPGKCSVCRGSGYINL